jgi:hypothetical protein
MQSLLRQKAKEKKFRWADLGSGNLNEEKKVSLHTTVAFKWPLPLNAQLVVSIRHSSFRTRTIEIPQCSFGGRYAQTKPFPFFFALGF